MSKPARLPERLLAAALLAALPQAALAVTTCSASSASMGLGTYRGDSSLPADSVGTVVMRCTRDGGPQNVAITLALGPSATSGTIAGRQLLQAGGSDLLGYNLYRDVLRQNLWGDAVGVNTVTRNVNIPNKSTVDVTFNIYGRMPGLQNVYIGNYGDSLLMTVSY